MKDIKRVAKKLFYSICALILTLNVIALALIFKGSMCWGWVAVIPLIIGNIVSQALVLKQIEKKYGELGD